jgi:DNA-binding CsgD family transcriptional regulator
VLDRAIGLSITDAGLEARQAADTRRLREAIDRAATQRLDACVTLLLPRSTGGRPLAVHVPPNRVSAQHGYATVVLSDPEQSLVLVETSFCRLYGLTRAEATVAALLLQGKSVEEAAAGLFVSIHTARTHLKRILLKTDTGRQGELLRLLLTPSAQMRLD